MLPPKKEGETVYGVDQFQLNKKDAEFLVPASYLTDELYVNNNTATPLKYDFTVHVFAPNRFEVDQEHPYYYEPKFGGKHLYFGGSASAEEWHEHLSLFSFPVTNVSDMKKHIGYAQIWENNDDANFTTTWSEERLPSGKTFPIAILQPGHTGNVIVMKDLATLLARQGIVAITMDLYPLFQRKINNTHVWAKGENYTQVGLDDCVYKTFFNNSYGARVNVKCWDEASGIGGPFTADSPYKEEHRQLLYEQLFTYTRKMLEDVFTGKQLEFNNTLAYGASLGWQQFFTLNAQQRAAQELAAEQLAAEQDPIIIAGIVQSLAEFVPETKYLQPLGTPMFKLSSFISSDGSHWGYDHKGKQSLPPMREGIAVQTMWLVRAHGHSNHNKYASMNMLFDVLKQSIWAEVPGSEHVDFSDKINKSGELEGIINLNFPHSPDGHNYINASTLLNPFGPFAKELVIPDQASNFKEDMQLYLMQLWAQRTLLPNFPVSKMTILQNCNIAAYQCEIGGQDSGAAISRALEVHIGGDPYGFTGPFTDDDGVGDSIGYMLKLSDVGDLTVHHGHPFLEGNTVATFHENGDFSVGGNIIVGGNASNNIVGGNATHPVYLAQYIDERVQAYLDTHPPLPDHTHTPTPGPSATTPIIGYK